ncbi:MAG TPA: ABC transporter substrate-binding protein [Opitutaceae bacterium]|nr:ABC transporter substrate-binding protein [Opitutaceae bacterium]
MLKQAAIILALIAVVVLPFALRPEKTAGGAADDALVIITPHNEAIRHEFGRAFAGWYRERTGRTVAVDWRVIGGTSEIARFLESEYVASFQNHWMNELRRPWSIEVQAAFANARLPKDASPLAQEARAAFLASDVGCGIDLFFGGGSFDFIRQADAGRLVESRILRTHPDWFTPDVIPQAYAGEPYWDAKGRWIGNVLSSYGIISNRDSLGRLAVAEELVTWDDLANPRLAGEVALCDPTKSSSIAKAFENMIQQKMQQRLEALRAERPGAAAREIEAQAVREGWAEGLRLLQRMGANARYFTDSSQKPPIDVSQGNSAVGVCIDFYGRYQVEAAQRHGGAGRLRFVTPEGGTVSSVDPIALLRGAPNREVAELFIEFTLSLEGQRLWNFRVGAEGGPERFALRRLPVRRDFYARADWKPLRSDPEAQPFDQRNPLIYRPEWTGGIFREMAFVIRVMCLDAHPDLVDAWRDIIRAGMPPAALAALSDVSFVGYDEMGGRIKQALNSKNKVDEVTMANELADRFRAQYRRAGEIARNAGVAAK